MRWFKLHPNWTIFIVWLTGSIFFGLANRLPINANSSVWWLILAIAIVMMVSVLAWSLKVKNRSLFNLFYLLIPFAGIFIVWGTDSRLSEKGKING